MEKWDQADTSIPQINDNIAKPIVAIMIMMKPSDFQGDWDFSRFAQLSAMAMGKYIYTFDKLIMRPI